MNEVNEINSQSTYFRYLNLVRKNNDTNKGDGAYLKELFKHDGFNWKLRNIAIVCNVCGQTEWIYCDRSKKETRYRQAHVPTQIPMLHLYLDLELEINGHMTMAQKRFISYRFYIKVVQNKLTFG